MATQDPTQTSNYLQQYLNDMQATQPDTATIGQRVTAASQNALAGQAGAAKQIKQARQAVPGYNWLKVGGGTQYQAGQALVTSFENQVKAAQQQTKNQAEALKIKGETTQNYIEQLRSMAPVAVQGATESIAAWNKYTQTADQYLQDSAARMAEVTADIKGTIEQYAQTNDSALAHSIQSGAYTWLQTSKSQERGIAERYGLASAEYRDWQDAKRASIGAMVSDLTAKAWDKTQQILNTGLGALTTAQTQMASDVNWAQKNSLDALQAAAAAGDQYRLQTTSYLMTLAAAENSAWGELAQWIDQMPVAAIDIAPLMQQLLEMDEQYKAQQRAEELGAMGIHIG